MSKEIISRGNPFEVEHVDRTFKGVRRTVLRVDDQTGDVEIHGVKVNGAAAVLVAKKTLSAAQILALDTVPIEIIPKPAAGKYIEVVSVHAMLKFNSAQYASVGATDYLQLRYTDGSGAKQLKDVSPVGFGDAAADAHLIIGHADSLIPANAKVVASLAGAWTTGDSMVTLEVMYRLRDLAI
jgi:hypothetical protein